VSTRLNDPFEKRDDERLSNGRAAEAHELIRSYADGIVHEHVSKLFNSRITHVAGIVVARLGGSIRMLLATGPIS